MDNPLIRLLYPDRCIFCSDVSEKGCCCKKCKDNLPYSGNIICIICGNDKSRCKCIPNVQKPFLWICAPFLYKSGVKRAIQSFKFKGKREAAAFFAPYIARQLKESFKILPFDLITCVPMNKLKELSRGYNQADLLASQLAELLDVEYIPDLLSRQGLLTQHDLRASFRRKNAQMCFVINKPDLSAGRKILVVDDIYTTGSTMSACCIKLKENGAEAVFAAVAARTPI